MFCLSFCLFNVADAQINVGGTAAPKSGAALEVTSGGTKGLLGPKVVLTSQTTWAPLADTAIEGMIVFNLGTNAGFSTKGYYYWLDGKWTSLGSTTSGDTGGSGGTDLVRAKLTAPNQTIYDAAAVGDWIKVSFSEYSQIAAMTGATSIGASSTYTNGTPDAYSDFYGCNESNVTVASPLNPQPDLYCVAVAFNMSPNATSGNVTTANIRFGNVSGNTITNLNNYGNSFSFTATAGGVSCFVCKKPTTKTPSNTTSPATTGGAIGAYVNGSAGRVFAYYNNSGGSISTGCGSVTSPYIDGSSTNRSLRLSGVGFISAQW